MGVQLNPYIEKLSWAEARELILPVNPEFVKHADELDLPESCCIFKVKYRYGDYLLREGRPMFRNWEGENVSIEDGSLPEILRKKLGYAPTVPMGITINKNLEIFFENHAKRIIPILTPTPGYIFSLTGVLSKKKIAYRLVKAPFGTSPPEPGRYTVSLKHRFPVNTKNWPENSILIKIHPKT